MVSNSQQPTSLPSAVITGMNHYAQLGEELVDVPEYILHEDIVLIIWVALAAIRNFLMRERHGGPGHREDGGESGAW